MADGIRQRANLPQKKTNPDDCTGGHFIKMLVEDFSIRGKAPSSVTRLKNSVKVFQKTWPDFVSTNVRNITEHQCLRWASRLRNKEIKGVGRKDGGSISTYNKAVSVLKNSLAFAVKQGVIFINPAANLTGMTPRNKEFVLPSAKQFRAIVAKVRASSSRLADDCADMIEFLAFSGARVSEGCATSWENVDEARGMLRLRGTKSVGSDRYVPLFAPLGKLLEKIRKRRRVEQGGAGDMTGLILRLRECSDSLAAACKAVGSAHMTHHDLRHLFATRCIESGVDIPTVSRWLGHADGGALAMRTYGHLRQDHSLAQAAKVTW